MKIQAHKNDVFSLTGDLVVIGMTENKLQQNKTASQLDKKLKGDIASIVNQEKFKGSAGSCKLIFTRGKCSYDYTLLIGLGNLKELKLETLRKIGATIQKTAKQIHAKKVITELPGTEQFNEAECAQAITEGFLLSSYEFTRYKKSTNHTLKELVFAKSEQSTKAQQGIQKAQTLAEGVFLARDMVNTPGRDMNPGELAKLAKKAKGITTRVHNLAQIRKMKMGAFLSVAEGSTKHPPYFIEMHYSPKGKKPKKKIALIGKGVTFDTGGYSLKPPKSMENMKDDMAGAAAVIALMSIIARLKPNVAVSGYVAATENMVDGHAQRPGDVCKAMNGTTIEVLNTDAEGRLTLADALCYANKKKPDLMIDMATLTGACLVSLGMLYSGVMGNDDSLINKILETGKTTGENFWHLPLPEEYKDDLKSPIADLKNIAGPYGGTLTAGLFLQNFVGKTKWAHIDIAGPSWTDKPLPYAPRGGTGVMVRTLAELLSQY